MRIKPLHMTRNLLLGCLAILGTFTRLSAQTSAKFNFSLGSASVSGWTNISGDPSTGVRSATSGGITVSSVGTANWVPISGVGSAYDGIGVNTTGFFPGGVLVNHWFQYSSLGGYNAAVPQFQISGLTRDSFYTIKMTGSSTSAYNTNPTQYTVAGRTVYGYIQVNTHNNTANGATFNNVLPDTNGVIRVYVNTVPGTEVGDICGIQITRGQTTPPPVITITNPDNGDILTEGGFFTINATASEAGGSIVKVQFFVGDTTKIGESTTAPYSANWIDPDLGTYKITAVAIDANGVSNSTSINVTIESLGTFWSTTGNSQTNPDSFFLGTVDSLRLAIRTKNIERVSILPTGNVGIGTISPTAQLHTTGSVRLAGLTGDSSQTRVIVSDSSGKLFYRNVATLATGTWSAKGNAGTRPDSNFVGTTDNQRLAFRTNNTEQMTILANGSVGIGTSVMPNDSAKLAVKGTIYAKKVRVISSGWADYVFKKDYQLPPLAQVEQYINAHQHLPGVIPASEVEKKGFDLGDNQVVLLQKIEELTLYLIDQHKKVQVQDRQLAEQQARLAAQQARLDQQQQEIEALKKLIGKKK